MTQAAAPLDTVPIRSTSAKAEEPNVHGAEPRIHWTSDDPRSGRATMLLPSALATITQVEETALAFAEHAGFDEDTVSNIALVAREAAANAVLHGNQSDPAKHVTAAFAITDEALTISIADQGEGLDPDTVPDPLAPENLLRPSGRGIFLMRALMDEVKFRKLQPGTEITLVKHRAEQP